jgi:hypothetical protein
MVFAQERQSEMDELEMTVDTLIDLDEPEALLETLKRAAKRKKGLRWAKLAEALEHAGTWLDEHDPKHDPPNQSLDVDQPAKTDDRAAKAE